MVTLQQTDMDVFKAVADPTRRAILDLLRRGEQPVGEIARSFPVSRPAISKHLRILKNAGLVRERPSGRQRICSLDSQPLRGVDAWLEDYRRFWQEKLVRLKDYVESHTADLKQPERNPFKKPRTRR